MTRLLMFFTGVAIASSYLVFAVINPSFARDLAWPYAILVTVIAVYDLLSEGTSDR